MQMIRINRLAGAPSDGADRQRSKKQPSLPLDKKTADKLDRPIIHSHAYREMRADGPTCARWWFVYGCFGEVSSWS